MCYCTLYHMNSVYDVDDILYVLYVSHRYRLITTAYTVQGTVMQMYKRLIQYSNVHRSDRLEPCAVDECPWAPGAIPIPRVHGTDLTPMAGHPETS